jgi:aspartate/methionine/tyrosine aminotransferase
MTTTSLDPAQLQAQIDQQETHHHALCKAGANIDFTRGKPAIDQLELAADLDGVLAGDYRTADGTDTRGYGGLDGIPEARQLGAELLGVNAEDVLAGGNSSLTLMYLYIMHACLDGPGPDAAPWNAGSTPAKFLCPAPGYDRHFEICEDFALEMIPVPMTGEGPDMEFVEQLIEKDPDIRGMWCVPKYSNPTGETYSSDTVSRIAGLARIAAPGFRVMWDNAYSVHDLYDEQPLENIFKLAKELGTEDSIVMFASTSKVSFAGAGVAFIAGSQATLKGFRKRLGVLNIGPDKVNQLRHVRKFKDLDGIRAHMQKHAELMRPKFEIVQRQLNEGLGNLGMGQWTDPRGGYFISFDTLPGLADDVVQLASEAGLKLLPAGATYPQQRDPENSNLRLAPSYLSETELEQAMSIFVSSVKLATLRHTLAQQ